VASDTKPRRPADAARTFRYRKVEIADGGKLVLHVDGSISQIDAAGATTGTWTPGDAEWAGHAIRLGVRPQAETTLPQSRHAAERNPTE
jgi:hypothetical protein